MADTKPTKESLLKHLDNVEKVSIENQAGKPNCNPFLWAKRNVAPLRAKVSEAKEISEALAKEVLAIKALDKPKDETVVATKQ